MGFGQEPYPEQVAVEVLTQLNERDAMIAATEQRTLRHYGPRRLVRHRPGAADC